MKTATQELIEFIDFSIKHCHDNERIRIHQLVVIKERAKECLEKEKEQILRAFELGMHECLAYDANSIKYYNQTYNKNK
jgi:hypothetical protein